MEETQQDLDVYLKTYNTKRPHQGRNMKGRTPETVFKASLPKTSGRKEAKAAA